MKRETLRPARPLRARRQALRQGGQWLVGVGLAASGWAARATALLGVRLWPAQDYTRVTLESDSALVASHVLTEMPYRLAVDIDGLELSPALRELVGKVRADDPYIAGVRVGQYTPKTVRLVFDLKQPVRPQQFALAPVGSYRHRLVFDLYPAQEADPLLALLKQRGEPAAAPDALAELVARIEGRPGAGTALTVAEAPIPAPTPAPTPGPTPPRTTAPVTAPLPHTAPTAAPAPVGRLHDWRAAASSPDLPAGPAALTPAPLAASPVLAQAPAAAHVPTGAGGALSQLLIVAIDPGHGGEDPGAIGPTGLREKDVVLALGLMLRDALQKQPNVRVMMTRDADFFVPLHERVRKARRVQADLLVSLHADAFMRPEARGASVFALSTKGATSSAAAWMASRENAADAIGGVNLKAAKDPQVLQAMLDMSTTAQIKDSLKLGREVLQRLGRVGRLHKPAVEQAGFAVLKAPDIPSILVETAFISNPQEENLLRDPAYRRELVRQIAEGIAQHLKQHPPLPRQRVFS